MSTLGQPTPIAEERDSSRIIIAVAVIAVIGIALGAAFFLREKPKPAAPVSPYLAQVKISDLKMAAAENFIGATVSYLDGTVTNTSDKTITHVVVEVIFKDDMAQVVQKEDLPVRVVRNNGAYTEPVDLNVAPLAPGKSEPFRLTFDSISAQWNRQYPEVRVIEVSVK